MKIGPADLPLVSSTQSQGPAAAGVKPAVSSSVAPTAAAAPGTTVELSQASAALRAEGSSPEFDAEKVARISQAIADGKFQVNPGVIADKLISNARELLSRGSDN
jgi:negative regulator of flagellin synthesis FlgM